MKNPAQLYREATAEAEALGHRVTPKPAGVKWMDWIEALSRTGVGFPIDLSWKEEKLVELELKEILGGK